MGSFPESNGGGATRGVDNTTTQQTHLPKAVLDADQSKSNHAVPKKTADGAPPAQRPVRVGGAVLLVAV